MPEPTPEFASVRVEEEPLREFVLKAYQENRDRAEGQKSLNAVRQFLSGAPGASPGNCYWFEEDPASSIRSFVADLENAQDGLARATVEPVLSHFEKMKQEKKTALAPNLSVYVSSLGGSLAVRARIDETLACGLIAAAILGVARVGGTPFADVLEGLPAIPDPAGGDTQAAP